MYNYVHLVFRHLHDLCEWGAKEGLNRLRNILKVGQLHCPYVGCKVTEWMGTWVWAGGGGGRREGGRRDFQGCENWEKFLNTV